MNDFSKQNLIDYLKGRGFLKSIVLERALRDVYREDFIDLNNQKQAYLDESLGIGFEENISQPSLVVFMLEKLNIQTGDKILEIGTGSGWQTALLANLVGSMGKVFSMEIAAELVDKANINLSKYKYDNIEIIKGDGSRGFSLNAPYDKIIIACAVKDDVSKDLLKQLRLGGSLTTLVGKGTQDLLLITRVGKEKYKTETYPSFAFTSFIRK